jgi:nucleoredoxin
VLVGAALQNVLRLNYKPESRGHKPMADVYTSLLHTPFVVTATGEHVPTASFKNKDLALYFSAHWCRPCQDFTPRLAEYYTRTAAAMQVVFVSLDRTKKEYDAYRKTMPWPALPFDPETASELSEAARVAGIPCLAVYNPAGVLKIANARAMVMQALAAAPKVGGGGGEGAAGAGLK